MNIILFGLSSICFACNSSNNRNVTKDSLTSSIETDAPEKIVDERLLIVPGRSVGELSLRQDISGLNKKLGRPDAGDAAMGKAWAIWYDKTSTGKPDELAIYSSYRDSNLTIKDIKQIRFTSQKYKTQDGFGVGRSLYDTSLQFPAMLKIATYLDEKKDSIFVYDSKQDGIGFEFMNGKSISVTVHPKGLAVNNTYLTLHPEWKLVE